MKEVPERHQISTFSGVSRKYEHSYEPRCEQLGRAQYFADVFGPPPHTFSLAIANLMLDFQNGKEELSDRSVFQVTRLQKAPSFLAHLYYATRAYYPEKWEQGHISRPIDLARCYDPRTLSAIIALSYLYKRAKRICHPHEWPFIAKALQLNTDIGMHLGKTFTDISTSCGLLGGAMIFLAQAAFHAEDPQGLQRYRRAVKQNMLFDPDLELRTWGCTSYQIAACLMAIIGFRSDYSAAFCLGFESTNLDQVLPDEDSARFRHVRAYLESVHSGRALILKDECASIEVEMLMQDARKMKERSLEDSVHWLARNKDDISPETLSELQGISWDHTAAVLQKLGCPLHYEINGESNGGEQSK